jgi:hypothetical protein
VTYNLYKLAHAYQHLHWFKLLVFMKFIVHSMLHKSICIMNTMLRLQFKIWFKVNDLVKIMARFKKLCGLLLVNGTINATWIHLQKSMDETFVTNYYSFKSKSYNI